MLLEEIQSLINSSKSLIDSFKIFDLKSNLENSRKELESPEIWQDNLKASKISQEISNLQKKIEKIENLINSVENLEIAIELNDEKQIQLISESLLVDKNFLENQQFLNGKFDSNNTQLAIHAGAGGIDAQDWASMLASMYQAFAKKQGWNCTMISLSSGEEGGIKSAFFEIKGENSYGLLKEEAGVHRLVRLSPFNSSHTRETSFALVEVLPEGLESIIEINLAEKDLKWDYFMSSGKGGQSVNTTYSAVRVTHLPTGITVTCQNQRNQLQNKAEALKYLKNKLVILELKKQKEYIEDFKGDFVSAEWGSQIRNYVLHPYKLVKDTRSGYETNDTDKIIEEGNLLDLIWSVKRSKK